MNYQETVEYLYNRTPLFQNVGGKAYKEGLENTLLLDEHLGHPHRQYKTIHVAGTNGKGSCAHTISAVLQAAGYRTGLYTSPHLVDFRERIRVNGEMISEEYVVDFVKKERAFFEPLHPSFFEVTTALAFKYFADAEVDIAVIEVGLGGRLDCTNIITPILSVITNISFDHTQFLGTTLAEIAAEKAGIIKPEVPVVVGEANDETLPVFIEKAHERRAPIRIAADEGEVLSSRLTADGCREYDTKHFGTLIGELAGDCQIKNAATILAAIDVLQSELSFTQEHVRKGFAEVCRLTGLMGRWQTLSHHPETVCDTGHNIGGWEYIARRLHEIDAKQLHIVFGMVSDKDINGVLALLPRSARYYFTRAKVARAMNEEELAEKAQAHGLHGECYPTVAEAYEAARNNASAEDFIYIGGSSFIVADLLSANV